MAAGSPEAAADAIEWALDRAAEAEGRRVQADRKLEARLLLVVDQLESLFGTPGQDAFTKLLRGLVNGGRVWLIATLRSDRYAEFQLDANLVGLKRVGAIQDLPPPGPAEIADVVKGPARAAGLAFGERNGTSLARVLVEAAPNAMLCRCFKWRWRSCSSGAPERNLPLLLTTLWAGSRVL
jgi:Novel STAND NTPase 1